MKQHLKKVFRKIGKESKLDKNLVLTQNERNLPLPASFFSNFKKSITEKDISFYPNLTSLTKKIAEYINVTPDNILLTPGSEVGIKTLFEVFDLKDKNIVTTDYCFPMYDVYAEIHQTELRKAKYKGMKIDINSIWAQVDNNTAFIILANPNSPLGDYTKRDDIIKLLELGIPVIIDEAYIEFSYHNSVVDLINEYSNLIVLRTFSKAFGAAGLRAGYIVSNIDYMKIIRKLRFMYEISGIAAKYCEFVLDNVKNYETYITKTLENKEDLYEALDKGNNSHKLINTESSWFFIRGKKNNDKLEKIFKDNKVTLRTLRLPTDNEIWYKFNYDLAIESTNLKSLLQNA